MNVKEPAIICPHNRAEWRDWLEKNHDIANQVWLVYYKVGSNIASLRHTEAIDEALCFGWIDSKGQSIDDTQYKVKFTRRKPTSLWSKVNKEKVARLIEQRLMTAAGLKSIETAKQNGSWSVLDGPEALIIPEDLRAAFNKAPVAKAYYDSLSNSDKKSLLKWIVLAKRQETRKKRISEIVREAGQNKKPKQF